MESCIALATKVIEKEMKGKSGKNIVLSPFSINIVMNMVAAGAGGANLEQLLQFLGHNNIENLNSDSKTTMAQLSSASDAQKQPFFSFANALWVDHGFPLFPSFQESTKEIYKALVKNIDILEKAEELRKEINSWAEKETKGLIKEMLPAESKPNPPFVLANTLYFKAGWDMEFFPKDSEPPEEQFHLLNGETIKVPFMFSTIHFHFYRSFPDFKVLKLPYQRGDHEQDMRFSMYIFLPHSVNGLKDLIEKLNSGKISLLDKNFHNLPVKELSKMWIPKWKFSYDFQAQDFMKEMGLTLPFNKEGADFTNMVERDGELLFISAVHHKACIEVNEEGTEAAADTEVDFDFGFSLYDPPPPTESFVADHPFLFMIREDQKGLVIFTGALLNPLSPGS
ncbi:hypothetical protein UlMin_000992 [Ulmus minor]